MNRILQQIKLFPTENNKPHTLSSATAILFDAHYQDSIATVLPTTADLTTNGINKIIIMDESAICTDPRKISKSHSCYRFVCECKKNGIEVNAFGIKAPDHHNCDYHKKIKKLPCLPGGGGGIFLLQEAAAAAPPVAGATDRALAYLGRSILLDSLVGAGSIFADGDSTDTSSAGAGGGAARADTASLINLIDTPD